MSLVPYFDTVKMHVYTYVSYSREVVVGTYCKNVYRRNVCITNLCPHTVCDGIGVGSLSDALAINDSNIESFRNCTKINGAVVLLLSSFSGYDDLASLFLIN